MDDQDTIARLDAGIKSIERMTLEATHLAGENERLRLRVETLVAQLDEARRLYRAVISGDDGW